MEKLTTEKALVKKAKADKDNLQALVNKAAPEIQELALCAPSLAGSAQKLHCATRSADRSTYGGARYTGAGIEALLGQ